MAKNHVAEVAKMLSLGVFPEVNEYDNHALHAEEHLKYIL